MAKYSIVQFPDKTFGVERKTLFSTKYKSAYSGNWHYEPEHIKSFCRFDTIEDAQKEFIWVTKQFNGDE